MGQVLFLLGAGASAGSYSSYGITPKIRKSLDSSTTLFPEIQSIIPTVRQMKNRILDMLGNFNSDYFQLRGPESYLLNPMQLDSAMQLIKEDLNWLNLMLNREPFVDVLAETLHATNEYEYERLRRILSLYFILEQSINGVDIRYKSFLTTLYSISKRPNSLPDNVKVFTWNYDYQFEEALVEKRGLVNLEGVKSQIQTQFISRHQIYDSNSIFESFVHCKLNGSCETTFNSIGKMSKQAMRFISKSNVYMTDKTGKSPQKRIQDIMINICEYYHSLNFEEVTTSICFAWDDTQSELISSFEKLKFLDEVSAVVVIGYSFPVLNYRVDHSLFSRVKSNNVYIQCAEEDFKEISDRFKVLRSHGQTPIHIGGLNDFHVPVKEILDVG